MSLSQCKTVVPNAERQSVIICFEHRPDNRKKLGEIELFKNDQHIDGDHFVIKHLCCSCIKRHTPYRRRVHHWICISHISYLLPGHILRILRHQPNSSPPSTAYMREWIRSVLVNIVACSASIHYPNQCWVIVNRPVSQIRAPSGGLSRTSGKLWQDYSNCHMFWT